MVIGNIMEPRMMGHRSGMSTLVVFFVTGLGWLLGPVGMLLSVPLTSVCKNLDGNHSKAAATGDLTGAVPTEKPLTGMMTDATISPFFIGNVGPDMYQSRSGSVNIKRRSIARRVTAQAPQGVRRALASPGVLLLRALSPLPDMRGEQGKPVFPPERRCGLNPQP